MSKAFFKSRKITPYKESQNFFQIAGINISPFIDVVYVLSKLYAYIPEFQSNVANQNNDQPKSINLTFNIA